MHNKSISPSYAEDLASGTGVGAAGRRRTPPPRLIYTTTVAQQKASSCVLSTLLCFSSHAAGDVECLHHALRQVWALLQPPRPSISSDISSA
jgi:hypothetical protein